jgi:hypothetical protein
MLPRSGLLNHASSADAKSRAADLLRYVNLTTLGIFVMTKKGNRAQIILRKNN